MRARSTITASIALVLLAGFACKQGFAESQRWSAESASFGPSLRAKIALYERLDESLRGRQAIGFFFDPPRSEHGSLEDYFVAQFALAPIRVRSQGRHSLVLGVFETEARRNGFINQGTLTFVKGVNSRVALFRKPGESGAP